MLEKRAPMLGGFKIKIETKNTTIKTLKQKQGVEMMQEKDNDTFTKDVVDLKRSCGSGEQWLSQQQSEQKDWEEVPTKMQKDKQKLYLSRSEDEKDKGHILESSFEDNKFYNKDKKRSRSNSE